MDERLGNMIAADMVIGSAGHSCMLAMGGMGNIDKLGPLNAGSSGY